MTKRWDTHDRIAIGIWWRQEVFIGNPKRSFFKLFFANMIYGCVTEGFPEYPSDQHICSKDVARFIVEVIAAA